MAYLVLIDLLELLGEFSSALLPCIQPYPTLQVLQLLCYRLLCLVTVWITVPTQLGFEGVLEMIWLHLLLPRTEELLRRFLSLQDRRPRTCLLGRALLQAPLSRALD